MLSEKLTSGNREVERIYEFSNISGKDVIKLVLTRQNLPRFEITNFEIPAAIGKMDANTVVDGIDVSFDRGSIIFYPDASNILWSYVIDTEFNRKQIALCLSKNWFRIVDTKVRTEIAQLGLEQGISIDTRKKPEHKMSPREEELAKRAEKAEEELQSIRKDMASIMTEFKSLKEEKLTHKPPHDVSFNEPDKETPPTRRGRKQA